MRHCKYFEVSKLEIKNFCFFLDLYLTPNSGSTSSVDIFRMHAIPQVETYDIFDSWLRF
jgi:hypothetical protein